MVRETRHLWVGNLPDNIREDRIREHFKRYGRVQNVKLLGRTETATAGPNGVAVSGVCATVAFMDIKSASKAHNAEHVLDERTLTTEYYEPAAIPSAAGAPSAGSSPAGSGYSGSSSSVNSASVPAPTPATVSRYHLSGGEEGSGTCALAATAAAPANWRGTNDSASEYCRRGNTPAGYPRYQRNNSTAPYSTPPSNVDRSTPHHRWYASGERERGATGGESTPSTPGGGTEGGGARRQRSGSGSSRSDSSSPEPSDASRASTPAAQPPQTPHTPHTPHSQHTTPTNSAARTPPTTTHHQWSTTTSGRPLAICVRNLPTRSTDSSLKDGLYHEYKKHGKVMWVKVVGQNADRYAVVRFKKPSDVEKALEVSQDKLFFGCKISVAPHQSCDEDAETAKPYETDIDEYHPKATRTLFIGNLEKDVTQQQLREKFKHFGRIIEIDIKKGSGGGSGYAFCQYASISSVVEAIRAMDGEYVGGSRVKLGFGKPVATTCVFVDGLTEHTEKQVLSCISRCGAATSVCVDRAAGAALIHFEQAGAAGAAVRELRRVAAHASAADPDRPRLAVDYASRECQDAFYDQLEKHGGGAAPLQPTDRAAGEVPPRYVPGARHDPLRYDSCSSRSRASSYGRGSSRTPRYPSLEHYDPTEYAAERRYRVYDELGSSPQTEETPYEDRLQSVVVSPHRSRRHRRDSSPEDRKHSKDRLKVVVGAVSLRRSRSGSRGGERHGGRRRHRRRRDGSGSRGSRAGTPLRDEPDAAPCEPRRPPRERPPLPMSLPLPRFAAQLLRAAPSAPRPAPAPAPDSPPRPPSASSSSAGSAPHSPSLEERIRSLDEKYEKWSGSRAQADAPDRARLRHRLLEVDINEVKPSEVVRSLLAKRSVFDEDSERLEGAGRAPSPAGSPRARTGPPPSPAPRPSARYPFPAHPAHAHAPDAEPDAERPADPRLNRPERPPYQPEKLGKINESDYRLEPRARLRTPSTDRPERAEPERDPRRETARARRDSLLAAQDSDRDVKEAIEKIDPDFKNRERRSSLTLEKQKSDSEHHHGMERRSSLTLDKHIKIEPDFYNAERRPAFSLDKHQKIDQDYHTIERRLSQTLDKHQKIDQEYHSVERRPSLSLEKYQKGDYESQSLERRSSQSLERLIKIEPDSHSTERKPVQASDKHQKNDSDHHGKERRPSLTIDKHHVEESTGAEDKLFTISPCGKSDVSEHKKDSQTDSSVTSGSDENDSRHEDRQHTQPENLLDRVKVELSTDKEPSSSDESSVKSDSIKLETDDLKICLPKLNDLSHLPMDSKLDHSSFQIKSESDKCKDITIQNNITKELHEFEMQHSHLNPINSIKTSKEVVANLSHELLKNHDKNGKERFNQNAILEVLHNTKLEKENIEFEKTLEKEKYGNNSIYATEKKSETDKGLEERTKHDREKVKHTKEKHEHEREKSKNHKTERASEKSDKEKRPKDDNCADKVEKVKIEKDSEKPHKDKSDRETEKKHNEDKTSRHHDHHRKDKRKDGEDKDTSKLKKEDKHKHEKSKKDGSKKDESTKIRKSSRDESSRDLCRKDSTDSSASRASHDSNKIKDLEQSEVKEDKAKLKLYDMFIKQESEKEKPADYIKPEPETVRIKSEIKDEKLDQLPEPPVKSKTNQILEPPFKCKPETIDKQRHYSLDSPSLECKRKERLNSSSSLPSHIGHKRRMSSQDSFDSLNEDHKKSRNETKVPERRDSKDSRSTERHKTTKFNKGHFAKIIESKTKDDKKNQVKPPDDHVPKDDLKDSKKLLKKNIQSDSEERGNMSNDLPPEGLHNDLDFLATLELRSSEEDERQKALRKEMKEKKRIQQLQQIQELQMQQDAIHQAELMGKLKDDKKQKTDEKKKDAAREKRMSTDRKSRDEKSDSNTTKRKNRKSLQSTDTSDSDEPKKHSIFDIIDDEPTYISMYDKVKARSCKNMQKQEEEKRQEKIKAKFSQLKQSRAKREEKKRSSWDEDSDSGSDRRKPCKISMDTSSDDEQIVIQNKKRDKSRRTSLDYERLKANDYYNIPSNEEDSRNKLSRKNSRTRIISDTSDDEISKRSISKSPNMYDIKKELITNFDSLQKGKDDTPKDSSDKNKKNSLLHLFGKSDSDDNKFKMGSEINDIKPGFLKTQCNDFSSESESAMTNRILGEIRKKHKKKQKNKYKFTFSDDESRVESSDALPQDGDPKHKSLDRFRRHSNKKEKRKDKIRASFDADDIRDDKGKIRKDKKSINCIDFTLESGSNNKKDGKMEDIFGPLSDESEKDETVQNKVEFSSHGYESTFSMPNDQLRTEEIKTKEKDENRRKKEKKKKERRPFLKEDENSLDVDAVSKAIEARLFADTLSDVKAETPVSTFSKPQQNIFNYTDSDITVETPKLNDKHGEKARRENKEKRKKKKRNREERRKEHHHSSHSDKYDKSDYLSCGKSLESLSPKSMLLDIPLPNDTQIINLSEKSDDSKSLSESPSLPRLTDSPPSVLQIPDTPKRKNSNASDRHLSDHDMDVEYIPDNPIEVKDIPMPQIPYENNIVQDLSEVPLPKDPIPPKCEQPKQDNFMPSFGSIDVSEDAVRSISNLEKEVEKPIEKMDSHANKVEKKVEEKPRAVISQEETADAVAALLGESFEKDSIFPNCYEEVESNPTHQIEIESSTNENENIPEEDAEEMRRAVQNLNASEMEMKPDTPLSDNDLLLIDTDTEEAEETPQQPVNVIPTSQPQNISELNKPEELKVVSKQDAPLIVTSEPNESNVKPIEMQIKSPLQKREVVSQPTSTATPVITSWTLTGNKLIEPHVVNIKTNQLPSRDSNENKPTHITANIVQIKAPHSQSINTSLRPIITPNRMSAPYQVINHMIRPQTPNIQPPTIKIPEPHIIYQKSPNIVLSPRMTNDPRQQSPKGSPQGEGMTSPRLANMAILSTSPQNLNSVGLVSPNAIQQRSPGQVTVVRMQQPPLSPIQSMHLPPGTRAMVSPNRPNSVLVQTQGGPIHFNRLPVTPVLAPISKPLTANNMVQQNKSIGVSTSPLLHQQKIISGDSRKMDQRNIGDNVTENSKIILSPTSLQHSTNPTVMAQNRLISIQNAIHASNLNSPIHFSNKVLINNMSHLSEKRDNHIPKSEHHNHLPFASAPIIHVANVNHSSAPIIQTGSKPIMCSIQDRGPNSNVIHSLNSQRLLTTAPATSVIQIDTHKNTPSVLSMAAIRTPTVLTKIDSSNTAVITTASHTNVVTTPLLLKTTSTPGTIRLSTRIDGLQADSPSNLKLANSMPRIEDKLDSKMDTPKTSTNIYESFNKQKDTTSSGHVAKCETDFEELLKDNTNEIKVSNDPEKKLEVNVGKTTTLFERKKSVETFKEEEIPIPVKIAPEPNSDKKEVPSNNQNVNEVKDLKEEITKEIEVKTKEENTISVKDIADSGFDKVCNEEQKQPEIKTIINANDNFFGITSQSESIDNQIKSLDENDSWSAKDVNIESVIKKVDSLCSDISDTDKNMEVGETPSKPNVETEQLANTSTSTDTASDTSKPMEISSETESFFDSNPSEEFNSEKTSTNKRGGRSVRGKRGEKNQDRVQTRQISKPARGATSAKRGRGRARVDKKIKNLVNNSANNMPGDVYDFHEDSGDETSNSPNKAEARPRLILTIKSPLAGQCTATPTSTLSITPKDQIKNAEKVINKEEKPEDFISPSTAANTRKSRRLLEKDVQRSTVDDVIEDVVKGTATKGAKEPGKKRQTRQAGAKVNQPEKPGSDIRKSPRGVKRTRDRSLSDASIDSSDEKIPKREEPKELKDTKIPKLAEPPAAPKIEPDPPQPAKTVAPAPVTVTPPSNPTPITKPPKKMISEMSAKLAQVFEAAAQSGPPRALLPPERIPIEPAPQPATITPALAEHLPAATGDVRVSASAGCVVESGGGEAALTRRLEGPVGGGMPAGASDPCDARVQSPALPHRPPSAHRLADRATPLLIRGGDGEGASMAAVGSGAAGGGGGARLPRGYAGTTASLPRGAHHPAAPLPLPPAHQLAHPHAKQVAVVGPHHHHAGAASRVTITSVPTISPQGQMALSAELVRSPPPAHQQTSPVTPVYHNGEGMYPHFSHQHYQMYQQHFRATQHESRATPSPYPRSLEAEGCEAPTPPLELRRPPSARVPRPAHSPAPAPAPSSADRLIMYAAGCGRSPPPAHGTSRLPSALPPTAAPGPPHASQVPREADSLQMLLRRYPVMWQGLLALKNDAAAVQMHFVGGNPGVAGDTLPRHTDGSTPPLRIAQRMRLEPAQLDQVHRKMKLENEHCILLALPCGRDHMDVLQQSTNLSAGFITYLQRKQAAGIVNVAPPGHQQAMYTVHIFPSCDFANENLNRIAPDLMHRVADIAHLLIVIATV